MTTLLLTPGLIDDFETFKEHPLLSKHTDVVEYIQSTEHSTYMLDVMFDAVRQYRRTIGFNGDIISNQVDFIARMWAGTCLLPKSTGYHHKNDGSRDETIGRWMYLYGVMYRDSFILSKLMSSGLSDIKDGEIQYYSDSGKTLSSTDIVNDGSKETFHLVFPGNPKMFQREECGYNIPLHLLN